MTGGRLHRAGHHIRGDRFLFTYADGLSDIDLGELEAFHRGHGRLATVTAVSPPSRYGELDLEGDAVRAFREKPAHTPGRINGGYFMLDRAVLDRLRAHPVCQRGLVDAMQLTPDDLRSLRDVYPDSWLRESNAVGSPEQCARRIADQFAAGAAGVVLHASAPREMGRLLDAWAAIRPAERFAGRSPVPGRS